MTRQSDRDKFLDEFLSLLTTDLDDRGAVYNFDELSAAIRAVAGGWAVKRKHIDRNHVSDPAPDIQVRYEIATSPRQLTEDEKDQRQRRRDAYYWQGTPDGPPPPAEVPVHRLMEQKVWWRTRDGKALRLKELDAGHARNLLALLERSAWDIHTGYLGIFTNAPDDVQAQAYDEDSLEWLRGTKFVRALRKKIRKDGQRGRE